MVERRDNPKCIFEYISTQSFYNKKVKKTKILLENNSNEFNKYFLHESVR